MCACFSSPLTLCSIPPPPLISFGTNIPKAKLELVPSSPELSEVPVSIASIFSPDPYVGTQPSALIARSFDDLTPLLALIPNDMWSYNLVLLVVNHGYSGQEIVDQFQRKRFSKEECLELRKAAVKGHVETARRFFKRTDNEGRLLLCTFPVTDIGETVLHIAAGAKQTRFVEAILNLHVVRPVDLQIPDSQQNNAFCVAVMVGAKSIAETMLRTNANLLTIPGGQKMTPLYIAATFGRSDMATFLYGKYGASQVVEQIQDIFYACVRYNQYDLAEKLLKRNRRLALVKYRSDGTALHMLARNPSAFMSRGKHKNDLSAQAFKLLRSLLKFIQDLAANLETYVDENKDMLFDAAKHGNFKFLAELINLYPDLIHLENSQGQTIFHIAVLHRHHTVFNLVHDIGFNKQLIAASKDGDGNNLLHLAAKYSPDEADRRPPGRMVTGAALEMQQEFKTFKEVESLVMPSYREMKNNAGRTPRQTFTNDHKDLLKRGEEWMKKTAGSCLAAIIAIMVFSFETPKSYNNNDFLKGMENSQFYTSTVADALSLSLLLISMLMFLSILTCRYKEEDFLKYLPLTLAGGFLSLLTSIIAFILSFGLSFYTAYNRKDSQGKVAIVIFTLIFAPVLFALLLKLVLLGEIICATFRSRRFKGFVQDQS